MRHKLLLIPVALLLGLLITLVDSSPGWDDTGISALALAGSCALLGAVDPARPWRWALLIGLWIPLHAIVVSRNYGSLLALAFAFAGAYLGSFAGRLMRGVAGAA